MSLARAYKQRIRELKKDRQALIKVVLKARKEADALRDRTRVVDIEVDAVVRVTSNTDAWLRLTGLVEDPRVFVQMLEGMLNSMVIVEAEFARKFPRECEAWRKEHDAEP